MRDVQCRSAKFFITRTCYSRKHTPTVVGTAIAVLWTYGEVYWMINLQIATAIYWTTRSWLWTYFIQNTVMTTLIIYKILYAHTQSLITHAHRVFRRVIMKASQDWRSSRYLAVVRAIIDSSLISWFGILSCAILYEAPTRVFLEVKMMTCK
jgi:hypothetical protein